MYHNTDSTEPAETHVAQRIKQARVFDDGADVTDSNSFIGFLVAPYADREKEVHIMKHIVKVTRKPVYAQINLGGLFAALGQILQAVGTTLATKPEQYDDPYYWY